MLFISNSLPNHTTPHPHPLSNYCRKTMKQLVACTAQGVDPAATSPYDASWNFPSACQSLLTAAKTCLVGELGVAWVGNTTNISAVKLIYGRTLGGCKTTQTYYAIPNGSKTVAKSITCKDCAQKTAEVRGDVDSVSFIHYIIAHGFAYTASFHTRPRRSSASSRRATARWQSSRPPKRSANSASRPRCLRPWRK